jgi:hypothetical protein
MHVRGTDKHAGTEDYETPGRAGVWGYQRVRHREEKSHLRLLSNTATGLLKKKKAIVPGPGHDSI